MACVVRHISPPRSEDVAALAKRCDGKNIAHSLQSCNQEAIDVLKYRIATLINDDNGWIAKQILTKHGAELDSMSDDMANDVRATLSDLIWFLVSAYYENAVAQSLGKPKNVYVALNVRDLFVGARNAYQKGDSAYRNSIEKWTGAFADFIYAIQSEPSADDEEKLSGLICTVSTQGVAGGLSKEFGQVLASAFYQFAKNRAQTVQALIAGQNPRI